MALDPSNGSSLEQLALKGLMKTNLRCMRAQPVEHCVLQNNAVDIYNTFFTDCEQLSSSDYEQPTVKIVCTFK